MYSDGGAILQAINYYIDHPIDCVRDVILKESDIELVPDQIEVLKALPTGKNIAVRSGHGVGKTLLEAMIIIVYLILHPNARVPCTAPTEHQLKDILWPYIRKLINGSSILKKYLVWTKTRVAVAGYEDTWFAFAVTARNPEAIAGSHEKHLLYVIDEASGIDEAIYEAIFGTQTTEAAQLIMFGNPTLIAGTFYAAFHENAVEFISFHFSSENSPLVTKEWCEEQARKYGKESDVYRVRVKGDFPKGNPDSLIPLELVREAINRKVKPGRPVVIGVDPAAKGNDDSVVCVRRGLYVEPLQDFNGIDNIRLSGIVKENVIELRNNGIKEKLMVVVDGTGVGTGVCNILQQWSQELNIIVIERNFGGNARNKKEYANRYSEMYCEIKEYLKKIQIPNTAELVADLTNPKYDHLVKDGRIKVEPKKSIRKRTHKSPDHGDALVMAFSEGYATPISLTIHGTKIEEEW